MRRIYDDEKSRLLEYLYSEPYYCTFILGDIEVFGLDGDIVKVFIDEFNDDINCVLMNYDTDFVIYSRGSFDSKSVAETLLSLIKVTDFCVSGKNDSITRIFPFIPDVEQRDTFLSTYDTTHPEMKENDFFTSRLLTAEDATDLLELYISIDEFYHKYKTYTVDRMEKAFIGSHFIGVYDNRGKLVGSAGTTAESQLSAMIVNVCSRKEYRGRGVAELAMSELLKILRINDMQIISLYFDNPSAGKLYHKLGFVDKGIYSTLRKRSN